MGGINALTISKPQGW